MTGNRQNRTRQNRIPQNQTRESRPQAEAEHESSKHGATARNSATGGATPKRAAAGSATAKDIKSGREAPKEKVAKDKIPEDRIPKIKAPKGKVPKSGAAKAAAPKIVALDNTPPRAAATIPDQPAPGKETRDGTRPGRAMPEKAAAGPARAGKAKTKPEPAPAAKPEPAPAAKPEPAPAAKPEPAPAARPEATASPEAAARPEAAGEKPPLPIDFERLTQVSTDLLAESGKAGAAVLRALESGERASLAPDEGVDIAKTLGAVAEYWLKDPKRLVEAQKNLSVDMISLWQSMLKQVGGSPEPDHQAVPPRDPRFAHPEWTENPYFNFIRQAYFLGARWANDLVDRAEALDPHTKRKARFYMRQLAGALSPSNFVMTNPELLRTTIEEHGENLARGMKMLAEDIEAGKGELKIRQTDATRFKVGENLATTPGKVIFRNELIELIQYEASTPTVFKRPLLIVPPWINKFYILDLNPEKSFIRWAVSQGLTVFVISWINPDERHRAYDFEAYMRRGILAALDAVEEATGEPDVDTIGYCVGGTLLGVTLAWLAQDKRADRIASATLFTTQVDFTHAGELLAFVDEGQIRAVEEIMARFGYLPGDKMASAFNMLRPNDLIWSYMVNNYLKGKQPAPFDLLYWNSDSTRMAEANHSFYLRNCYLHNRLAKGEMVIGGRRLDLGKVTIPIYNLATREDHIAPAKSVFEGSKLFGGEVTYVMAGSGHIAGVINPVSKPKYQFWTGGRVEGAFEDWAAAAKEQPGTWWPHWLTWLTAGRPRVPARAIGGGRLKPIADAPGSYVRMKS